MAKRKSPTPTVETPPQYDTAASDGSSRTNASNVLPALVLAFLAVILYGQTLWFDYVLDDTMVIVKNKFTQKGFAGIADIFRYESFRGYFGEQKQLLEGDRYRPLSIATFAAEQSLFGGNRAVSHGINVMLYALTGIFLWRVLRLFFLIKNENSVENQWFRSTSFWVAAFFLAHPLHVEVIANIKGRDEILALLGALGALYFSLQFVLTKKKWLLFGAFGAFLCGILSKESVITFLVIVPLTLHFFTQANVSEKIIATVPAVAATAVYLLLRVNAIGYLLGDSMVTDVMNNPFYGMGAGEKLATIFYTLLLYLKLHIVPYPLTHDYYPYQIPRLTWAAWQAWLSVGLHLGLVVVILRGWHRRTVGAYAAAFYLVALSIVSNVFVSVGTFMNERFVYPASLAFCLVLAHFLSKFWQKKPSDTEGVLQTDATENRLGNWAGWTLSAAILLYFSILTLVRVPDWRDGTHLNAAAIKTSPNSARANCFYGVSLWENQYAKLPQDAPENTRRVLLDSMRYYFDRSVSIVPTYNAAQKMRAGIAAEYYKLDKNVPALLTVLGEVNRSGTYDKFVLDYLSFAQKGLSTREDLEKMADFYRQMIDFYKNNPKTAQTAMPNLYEKMLGELPLRLE